MAEAEQRLDFRDPQTMALQNSTHVDCKGINHADFSADLSYAIFTCEFSGRLVKIDMKTRQVIGYLHAQLGRDAAGHPARPARAGTSGSRT